MILNAFINMRCLLLIHFLLVTWSVSAAEGNANLFTENKDDGISHKQISVSMVFGTNARSIGPSSVLVPLRQVGRLFMVEVRIDDIEGNLIFDTGASELVLNKTYFRNYAGYEKGTTAGGVTGKFGKITSAAVGQMDVSGIYYEKISADLADLGHIEDSRGVKILGLFGIKMIDDLEVIFDAAKCEMRLSKTDRQGNRLDPEAGELKFEFNQELESNYHIMMIRGRIGDKTLNFCLDTGAEINTLNSNIPKKVMSTIKIVRRSTLGGARAGNIEALYGTMNELEFGNHQFGIMNAVLIDLSSMSESYGFHIDGMLGYDFWRKGVFCFNLKKGTISFNVRKGEENEN